MLASKLENHAGAPRSEAFTSNLGTAGMRELSWNKSSSSGRTPSVSVLHEFDDIVRDEDLPTFLSVNKAILTFPEALLLLLAQAEREAVKKGRVPEEACIVWTTTGRALVIRDQQELVNELMPIAYAKTKFSSFVRKLYRWGFRQLSGQALAAAIYKAGEKAYWHPLFQRDNKHLAINMRSITADTRRLSECSQNTSQGNEIKSSETASSESAAYQGTSNDLSEQCVAHLDPPAIRPGVPPSLSRPSLEQPLISSPSTIRSNREREQFISYFTHGLIRPSLAISDQQLAWLVGMPRFDQRHDVPSMPTAHNYSFATAACYLQPGMPQMGYDQRLQYPRMMPPSEPMFGSNLRGLSRGSLSEEHMMLRQHFSNI